LGKRQVKEVSDAIVEISVYHGGIRGDILEKGRIVVVKQEQEQEQVVE
jgi:hypothetical protein